MFLKLIDRIDATNNAFYYITVQGWEVVGVPPRYRQLPPQELNSRWSMMRRVEGAVPSKACGDHTVLFSDNIFSLVAFAIRTRLPSPSICESLVDEATSKRPVRFHEITLKLQLVTPPASKQCRTRLGSQIHGRS